MVLLISQFIWFFFLHTIQYSCIVPVCQNLRYLAKNIFIGFDFLGGVGVGVDTFLPTPTPLTPKTLSTPTPRLRLRLCSPGLHQFIRIDNLHTIIALIDR